MNKKLVFFIFFLWGVLLSGNVMAQVATKRSTDVTKIGGKEYYMHRVKSGETLYGISSVYNVTIEEIEMLNPEVKNGLKAGHVLGIPKRPPKESQEPEVAMVEPKPEPKPEQEPVVTEPQPQPEPIVETPKPIQQQEIVKPEPEPEPIVIVPEPKQEPVIVEPDSEPEAVVSVPDPQPVAAEPEQVVEQPKTEEETISEAEREDHKLFFDGKARVVRAGEDLYDIAKEYGIDLADFRASNPGLSEDPTAGTRIVIPNIANENDYILHHCERNERVTSLLKRWKVSENDFRKMNVSVGTHVFVNQVVLIPIQPIHDFYWIQEKPLEVVEEKPTEPEPVVEEELVQEEVAQTIDFDVFDASPECVAKAENALRRYNVALMIPLYLQEVADLEVSKENLPKLQKARSLSFVQFYEGFMMAVDKLEDEGLKLDLTVLDVTDNVSTAERALSEIRGEDYDLIVGPFFGKSFAIIEEYAKAHDIVVVNPLSTRESVIEDNPNVVKVKPGEIGQILTISSLVKNLYFDSNVFIVSKERKTDSVFLDQLEHHLNLAVNDEVTVSGNEFLQFARNESERLEMGSRMVSTVDVEGQVYSTEDFRSGSVENVVLSNAVKRYAYSDMSKLKSQLSGVRENVIVAYGDENVFATQVLNSLAKETERFPITLICAPAWAKFEKLLVDNLLQMKAIYLGDGFVDYHSADAKHFVTRFRQRYAVEPQSYAFEGYDMAMFFLSALMHFGDEMLDCLDCCKVPLLHTHYRFFNRGLLPEGSSNGRENQYWNVYQYDNEEIELKPIDPFKKVTE